MVTSIKTVELPQLVTLPNLATSTQAILRFKTSPSTKAWRPIIISNSALKAPSIKIKSKLDVVTLTAVEKNSNLTARGTCKSLLLYPRLKS
jgi:hypothetical protein